MEVPRNPAAHSYNNTYMTNMNIMHDIIVNSSTCSSTYFTTKPSVAFNAIASSQNAFDVKFDILVAILKKARAVATESDHPLSTFFHVLPSRRRYRCIKCKTSRYSRSFVPVAIRMLNAK